ncbi:hypothetical protein PSEUBRA_004549 [Kalmanozyma brasiliensis GHG001]|uniref:Thioesterase n=1 Tax=Kalmanozyma brasiliensis (strain GHG001) TaxID=1365824 RepID=V5E8K3_KALBG|nr:uncharacterized protein PSEUBRA_004549 [Kalmanozyma brasiliensis GHG001]EST06636.1 hypothetical protein PSEUBRA_004549 [Kalmanozyma brasiliensis GHG001]
MASTSLARTVGLGARRIAPSSVHSTARCFTTASALKNAQDDRPASSQIFTPSDVQAGIAALSAAGYDASTVWEQRVVWGDHDQFQHVNNVHFVRWFESARMFFASTLAKEFPEARRQEIERGTGKSFILAGINVRYRRPVVYPDTILVGQACELPLGKDRFMLRGAAYSLAQKTIVAVSAQDCVTYDYTKLKKCDIPEDIKQALEARGSHFDKKL